ncbi:MAG: bifunctional GNAT family N-acetyltransferase/class I SAM-dependent methyltransferase [Nocardioides sp.]
MGRPALTRRATEDDWETWREIRLRSLLDSPDAFGSTYDRELAFTEADWRGRLHQGPRVLVSVDGCAVALGGGFPVPEGLMVFGMWTDPAHRGHGHATAVLDVVVGWARERDLPVELHVNLANPGARAAYEHYGFVASGELEPLRPGSDQQIERMWLPGESKWSRYNDAQLTREPRDLCRRALAAAGPGAGRLAVDLGCGAGVETRALLDAGWRVLAVDSEPTTPARLARTLGGRESLEVRVEEFATVRLPAADLVHSAFALPFLPRAAFPHLWGRVAGALRPGGWLAVDLVGDRDSWAADDGVTTMSRDEVDRLLAGWEAVEIAEEELDGRTFSGTEKHWHVFHVLARRSG